EALRLGGKEVTLYYRRTEAHMPAYPHEIEEARNEGVRFQVLTDLVGFQGTDHLEALELQYMKLDEPDGSGRPRPVRVPGTEFRVPCETAIMAVGQERRTGFLEWIEGITLESGLIRIDQTTGQTTNPKFFAGGDSLNGGATAVEAVQNGKTAADGIDAYLREARA
ncbi:MAG TPA: FAD-dependent oxidoreductase, partial [Spirochaetia bacterium]|nr:FAD-dependent oxidoreductase [Spirochaetia bacterium]